MISAPVSWRPIRRCIERMGALQIDAINTVIRSHYMPVYSRLGYYDRSLLDNKLFRPEGQTASRRTFFEYWGHECSLLPLEFYSLFRWRMEDARRGVGVYKQLHELATRKPDYVKTIKREVEARGRSTSRELSSGDRGPGMWEWSQSKQALEYLFCTGDLSSAGRRGFERLYSVTENIMPGTVLNTAPLAKIDAQSRLIEIAAKALGVATESDLRDYFRIGAKDAAVAIAQLVEDQRLLPVSVQSWDKIAYMLPATTIPRLTGASALLTPFDPLVWHRERTLRMFNFHYRIEIYVPESKRQYGYYVLPFLVDDQIAARVDLKSDRNSGQLIVQGAWKEHATTIVDLAQKLSLALHDLSSWLDLERVTVRNRGNLARQLREALR